MAGSGGAGGAAGMSGTAGRGGASGGGGASGAGGSAGKGGTSGAGGAAGGSGGTGSGTGPCGSLCSDPITFTGAPYMSGALGTGATCHETTGTISGFNCSNMTANAMTRIMSVNGMDYPNCGMNQTPPAKVAGGYCIQVTAGNPNFSAFAIF